MIKTGNSFHDRLIDRMDRLDPSNLQSYILRLVREKGFLETVFNTIREGVIVLDSALQIRFINLAAQSLLGIGESASGQRIDRYFRDIDWTPLLEADPAHWQGISRHEIEVFYPTHRFLSFYLVPMPVDEDDEVTQPQATLILHDVTQFHEDAMKHVESQRVQAITMLAAGVAHELGNPLNSLNIHLQLLSRCLSGIESLDVAEEARDLLSVATKEVERLDTIVHNFLQAVRPVPPDLKPVNIRALLEETLAFMKLEIEDRSITVDEKIQKGLPSVLGDADQLKQAFYNLLKNALQAMTGEGTLSIVTTLRDDFLDISFHDTGKGISKDDMTRIMDPYFTTRTGGTGLGLLIVDRIVRTHGGELAIHSTEGEGASFTISLPLKERRVRLLQSPERPIDIPTAKE